MTDLFDDLFTFVEKNAIAAIYFDSTEWEIIQESFNGRKSFTIALSKGTINIPIPSLTLIVVGSGSTADMLLGVIFFQKWFYYFTNEGKDRQYDTNISCVLVNFRGR